MALSSAGFDLRSTMGLLLLLTTAPACPYPPVHNATTDIALSGRVVAKRALPREAEVVAIGEGTRSILAVGHVQSDGRWTLTTPTTPRWIVYRSRGDWIAGTATTVDESRRIVPPEPVRLEIIANEASVGLNITVGKLRSLPTELNYALYLGGGVFNLFHSQILIRGPTHLSISVQPGSYSFYTINLSNGSRRPQIVADCSEITDLDTGTVTECGAGKYLEIDRDTRLKITFKYSTL